MHLNHFEIVEYHFDSELVFDTIVVTYGTE